MSGIRDSEPNVLAAKSGGHALTWTCIQYLQAIDAANEDVIALVLPIASETVCALMANLEGANAAKDHESLARAAHTMKSAGGYLGAIPVVRHAQLIEQFVKINEPERLQESLVNLHQEILHLLKAINEVNARNTARTCGCGQ